MRLPEKCNWLHTEQLFCALEDTLLSLELALCDTQRTLLTDSPANISTVATLGTRSRADPTSRVCSASNFKSSSVFNSRIEEHLISQKIRVRISIAGSAIGLIVALMLFCTPGVKAQDEVELFGGFSYVRGDVTSIESGVPICPTCTPPTMTQHPSLPGWEFSGAYKLVPFLSANVDFGEQYGKVNGGKVRLKTILFGPQLSLPAPLSPFVHAEFGFAHQSVGAFTNTPFSSPGTDTSFATALGGGLDLKAVPLLALRLIQIDYLRTSLYGRTQNEPRISAGIVLRF